MKLYRVKDWAKHYENNRTKEMKDMRWVPFPNTHDGDGYTQLVSGQNGAAMLGAWVACVQVASKCDPRGTLLRGGGKAHDAGSISRITRLDEKIINDMLLRASSRDIGWLEIVDINEVTGELPEIPQEGAPTPQVPANEVGGGIPFPSLPFLPSRASKKLFVAPTLDQAITYAVEIGMTKADGEEAFDFYTSKGWVVGKSPMKDWRSSWRNWKRKQATFAGTRKPGPKPVTNPATMSTAFKAANEASAKAAEAFYAAKETA
jgi:hypothetical protein